ncbi:hypothetical protein JCM30471_26730 [Desulfuromonas carbonis]|uniref:hypothetical protein n=1 Tax=Desulfuromonas sp. DDH964 TaxID=1823759 RepID=UPI00078C875C|nr:hypothetical protein [Desulfuromonas sp. DDH964]AMV70866.1 hypothetical protein DBW_0465 [Desulfuromonas sp. DDH964]
MENFISEEAIEQAILKRLREEFGFARAQKNQEQRRAQARENGSGDVLRGMADSQRVDLSMGQTWRIPLRSMALSSERGMPLP